MSGFSLLMLLFATAVLLIGYYMFTGHEVYLLTGRATFKNLSKGEWKNIGKWTMITSILIYLLGIFALFIK